MRSHNGSAQLVKPASTSRNPAQILAFYKFSQFCTGKQHHRNYRADHTKVTAHTTFSLQQSTTSHSIVSENWQCSVSSITCFSHLWSGKNLWACEDQKLYIHYKNLTGKVHRKSKLCLQNGIKFKPINASNWVLNLFPKVQSSPFIEQNP